MTLKALLFPFISMICLPFLSGFSAQAEPLRVFAASSLAVPLTEIAEAYEAEENQEVTIVFASTSLLARQIFEGAPADVFISANESWMNYLQDSGDVGPAARQKLVSNELLMVFIPLTPDHPVAQSEITQDTLLRFLDGRRFGICDPSHVPCGIYAQQALKSAGLWETLESSLAYAPDARALLAWLDRGELGAGILYRSDVEQWDADFLAIAMHCAEYGPILYEIAPVETSISGASAVSFTEYVIENTQSFIDHGFTRLPESAAIAP